MGESIPQFLQEDLIETLGRVLLVDLSPVVEGVFRVLPLVGR